MKAGAFFGEILWPLGDVEWLDSLASAAAQVVVHRVMNSSVPALRRLTKWFQLTRLVTRTKEYYFYASIRVIFGKPFRSNTNTMQNESEGVVRQRCSGKTLRNCGVGTIDRSGDSSKDLSKSVKAVTR